MTFGHQQQQLYLYRCASCGNILKETDTPIDSSILRSLHERCTGCDGELQEQTIAIEKTIMTAIPPHPTALAPSLLPSIERAYDLQSPKLTFDIQEIDSMQDLGDRGAICVTSRDGWHANTLVTRACVRALLPKRQGGFGSPSVVFIDAGNCSDVYECVDFARQYGLDTGNILDGVIVSRPFTIHQLARLVAFELQSTLQRFAAKLVVITDIMHMFMQDPQLDQQEARWIIKEIASVLRKLSTRCLIIVSMGYNVPEYAAKFLSFFDSRIDIDGMQVQVYNRRYRSTRTSRLPRRDLKMIPAR